MKNLSVILSGLALAAISFAGCEKSDDCVSSESSDKMYDVSFFTSKAQGVHKLYIDGVDKGTLNYFAAAPQCGQQFDEAAQPLKLQLPAGTYTIAGRNGQGDVTTSATFTISEELTRVSGNLGGMSVTGDDESCVIVGLSE